MELEALKTKLNWFNPNHEVILRVYTKDREGYTDLQIKDVRISKDKIVISNKLTHD